MGKKGEAINRWEDMREERRGADEGSDERSQIKEEERKLIFETQGVDERRNSR